MEMEAGGRLFFDLFVAMVNHMVSFDFRFFLKADESLLTNFSYDRMI